jgi:glutathione gamma-glutamylcysteinyltransferase
VPTPRRTFHKRELPSDLISFTSAEGKTMFHHALQAGNLEAYFPLSEQFITQNEPAFCGMGSLAMVGSSPYHAPPAQQVG